MRLVNHSAAVALAVTGAFGPRSVESQERRFVEGTVVDSSGAPVPYANIIATGSTRRIAADANGKFRLSMDSSAKRVIAVRRVGYHPLSINLEPWPDSSIRVILAAATRTLSTITVEVERSQSLAIHGFYERISDVERGINHGFFITPEEIEGRKGARLTDLVSALPAVRIKRVGATRGRYSRTGWEIQGLDGCQMTVYVDGVRFQNLNTPIHGMDSNQLFINDLVPTSTISGIEVYPRSVTAPPRYQSLNGLCGVVLIWTK